MLDEELSRWRCTETGWETIKTVHFDASIAPFWYRAWINLKHLPYNGLGLTLKMLWHDLWCPPGDGIEMTAYYSQDGGYIGPVDGETVQFLRERGIEPELGPNEVICCIGFCAREQQWYSWGKYGHSKFGVGDMVTESHICTTSGWNQEYLDMHPEKDHRLPAGFVAETLSDAKRMAIAFASAIG